MGNSPTIGTPRMANDESKTYKRLLKDIKKLRIRDETKRYNPHRRPGSILDHLPLNLKQFSKTIHTVNEFWLSNIKHLTPDELHAMAMLCYCYLYCQAAPRARELLLQADRGNVPSHTMRIFTIFEYVIRIMSDSNPMKHVKLFKQLKAIGLLHKPYHLTAPCNVDIYEKILQSINYAMEQTFHSKYTVRVRFCFTQLYRVIINIINNNDLQTIVLADNESRSKTQEDIKIDSHYILKDVDQFLNSFEDCLSNEVGALYFKKYLEEQFCVENYLFHEAVLKYRSVKKNQRIKVGTDIIDTFIKDDSEKQVNISSGVRNKILGIIHLTQKMNDNKDKYQNLLALTKDTSETTHKFIELTDKKNNDLKLEDIIYSAGFTDHLFDAAYNEIFCLMRTSLWTPFSNTILGYCNNDHFIAQQQIKYNKRKKDSQVKRNIIKNVNDLAAMKKKEDSHRKSAVRKSIIVISKPQPKKNDLPVPQLNVSKKIAYDHHHHDQFKMDYVSSTDPEYDGDSEGSCHNRKNDKNGMMISRTSNDLKPKPIRTVPNYEQSKERAMSIQLQALRQRTEESLTETPLTETKSPPHLIESSKTSLRMLYQSSLSNENTAIVHVSSNELLPNLDWNDSSLKAVNENTI